MTKRKNRETDEQPTTDETSPGESTLHTHEERLSTSDSTSDASTETPTEPDVSSETPPTSGADTTARTGAATGENKPTPRRAGGNCPVCGGSGQVKLYNSKILPADMRLYIVQEWAHTLPVTDGDCPACEGSGSVKDVAAASQIDTLYVQKAEHLLPAKKDSE